LYTYDIPFRARLTSFRNTPCYSPRTASSAERTWQLCHLGPVNPRRLAPAARLLHGPSKSRHSCHRRHRSTSRFQNRAYHPRRTTGCHRCQWYSRHPSRPRLPLHFLLLRSHRRHCRHLPSCPRWMRFHPSRPRLPLRFLLLRSHRHQCHRFPLPPRQRFLRQSTQHLPFYWPPCLRPSFPTAA
jgi:hypothetical protein